MKLRFGIDAAVLDRIAAALDARCGAPSVARRISDVYLDTPDDELAARGIALRYRFRLRLDGPGAGGASRRRPWKRQELWGGADPGSLGKLGIKRLKQRLDATFTARVERRTWRLDEGWANVSLDQVDISTGAVREAFTELRVTCRRKHADDATRLAVELGATRLATTGNRERGAALLGRAATPSPG